MSELDELRERIRVLEIAWRGTDHDESTNSAKIRATHHLVQALSITQGEHTSILEELRADMGRVDGHLGRLRTAVGELRDGQQEIVRLLTQLIEGGQE